MNPVAPFEVFVFRAMNDFIKASSGTLIQPIRSEVKKGSWEIISARSPEFYSKATQLLLSCPVFHNPTLGRAKTYVALM